MNGDWYYMRRRWIGGAKKVGPITDHDLLIKIDQGHIKPDTLVLSSKTRNRWIRMSEVGPAIKHWRELHPDPAP